MTELTKGMIVQVDWLDEQESLQEQELLCETTTYGVIIAADDEFLVVANRRNAVDGGEATVIPTEKILETKVYGVEKR